MDPFSDHGGTMDARVYLFVGEKGTKLLPHPVTV